MRADLLLRCATLAVVLFATAPARADDPSTFETQFRTFATAAHINDNLPILLAGGGFKHAVHLAYDRKDNKPMSNLFVRMLQQMGIEMDKFGSSTGLLSDV